MTITRRRFCEWLSTSSGLAASAPLLVNTGAELNPVQTPVNSPHLGNLYPFVQQLADRSPQTLSFLRAEHKDLKRWQRQARAKVFEHLFYDPPPVAPQPQLIRRTDKGDYVEEYLTFQTAPDVRVPAYVLIPKRAKLPAPGLVALHS